MHAIAKALQVASRKTNANPSDAQKESGNYAKGKLSWMGETIAIENPKGSKRSGVDVNGKRWECTLPSAYGYFLGTVGRDGDHVDCYIGDDHDSKKVFVIDQIDAKTGKFDEHKVLLSFPDKDAAVANYKRAFSDGKGAERIGHVAEMSIERFREWLNNGNTKAPVAKGYAHGGAVYEGARDMANPDTSRKVMQAISLALETARKGSERQMKADGGAAGIKGRDGTQSGYAPRQAFVESYQPTWRDRVALALRRAMGNAERQMSPAEDRAVTGLAGASGAGAKGGSFLDYVPGVGQAMLGADALQDAGRGNNGAAIAQAALMAVPYGVGKSASRFFRHGDLGAAYPAALSEMKAEARFGQSPSLAQELKDPDTVHLLSLMEQRLNRAHTPPPQATKANPFEEIAPDHWYNNRASDAVSARHPDAEGDMWQAWNTARRPSEHSFDMMSPRQITGDAASGMPREAVNKLAGPRSINVDYGDILKGLDETTATRHAAGGVARPGRAEGGPTRDPVMSRLAETKTFRDILESDPRGRFAYDPGSIRSYDEPSIIDKALAVAEWPARTYADQFGRATDSVAEAIEDPSLPNLTNAGVQTGLAAGSPLLTGASGALGFGVAGMRDLAPSLIPSADAKEKRRPGNMKPAIFEEPAAVPAPAFEPDGMADKVRGDPQLEVLYQAYKDAQAKATASVPGVDKASSDDIRKRASDQATNIMGQIATALENKSQAKRDIEKGNYDQQVEDAVFARNKARSRDKRFSDTAVGQVYDKVGVAPVLAGAIPGAVLGLAKGPAKDLAGKLGVAATGAGFGMGAAMAPDIYNMTQAPAANPEREAMEAYAFNLPDTHPDKIKAKEFAASLPPMNPVQQSAKENFSDPVLMAERLAGGAFEGAGGAHIAQYLPRAVGGLFKPSTYGFGSRTPVQLAQEKIEAAKAAGLGQQADLATLANREAAAKLGDSKLLAAPPSSGLAGPVSKSGASAAESVSTPAVASSGSPVVSRALTVAKDRAATPPAAPLTSEKASNIIKHFKKENVIVRKEGDRAVARIGPGQAEGGRWTSAPKRGRSKASKDNASTSLTKGEDVPVDKNGIPIKPPKDIDPNGPGNFRSGGVAHSALALARRYARGGVVVGPVVGHTGGREDALPVDVPAGSFVVPADVVSALGTGNTLRGNKALDEMFGVQTTRAAGGAVPIKISDGEHVISPETVTKIGRGDMEAGHRALEQFVLDTRRKHIETLKSLPGPSR